MDGWCNFKYMNAYPSCNKERPPVAASVNLTKSVIFVAKSEKKSVLTFRCDDEPRFYGNRMSAISLKRKHKNRISASERWQQWAVVLAVVTY